MNDRLVRFLLVEDDDDHAYLIRKNLEKNLEKIRVHNDVERVADGVEALAYLRREGRYRDTETPDVVLLDLKLPKLDGHEVLEAIKNDHHLRRIPVVVLTTSDAAIDRTRAYEQYANSYLVKPVDFEEFRKLVNDLGLYWSVWNQRS